LNNAFVALNDGGKTHILRILFEAKAMALGGYKINLDKCCGCGRPYTGEGRAVFKTNKGCIACLKCEQESKLSPGLGPDTVKVLKLIQASPWSEAEKMDVNDEMIREIRPVLKLHMEYRIGRRLKTAEFLD